MKSPIIRYLLPTLLLFLVLAGVGCIKLERGQDQGIGGVWKTSNRGEKWGQRAVWLAAAGVKNMGGQNVFVLHADPQDRQAIYAGTQEGGLFYSYDGAASWMQAPELASGMVRDIAVDPKDKCTIYVAMGQRLWRSTDCSRSFESRYFETRGTVAITEVEVDWFNPNIIYIGTSAGDIIKSSDAGRNWTAMARLRDAVNEIYMDAFDSRILYAGLNERGLRKTTDGGVTWQDLAEGLEDLDRGRRVRAMAGDATTRDLLYVATNYGILRTRDGGASWEALGLLTPPKSVTIRSMAVNPQNGNELYYATDATFYKTSNGGANWNTEKLPTRRAPTALLVDAGDSNTVYMGMTLFKD